MHAGSCISLWIYNHNDGIVHTINECLNRNREVTNKFMEDLVFEMHRNAEN